MSRAVLPMIFDCIIPSSDLQHLRQLHTDGSHVEIKEG